MTRSRTFSPALLLSVSLVGGLVLLALVQVLRAEVGAPRAEQQLDALGVPAAAAQCDRPVVRPAYGAGDHRHPGTPLRYRETPPATGPHWENSLRGPEIRSLYTPRDRPPVERLVHALEHGHTILWYDPTVTPGTATYRALESIGRALRHQPYLNIAPWGAADGGPFPSGKHLALTHWTGPGARPADQKGVWQFCAAASGAVVEDFAHEFPADDAPEPGAP